MSRRHFFRGPSWWRLMVLRRRRKRLRCARCGATGCHSNIVCAERQRMTAVQATLMRWYFRVSLTAALLLFLWLWLGAVRVHAVR